MENDDNICELKLNNVNRVSSDDITENEFTKNSVSDTATYILPTNSRDSLSNNFVKFSGADNVDEFMRENTRSGLDAESEDEQNTGSIHESPDGLNFITDLYKCDEEPIQGENNETVYDLELNLLTSENIPHYSLLSKPPKPVVPFRFDSPLLGTKLSSDTSHEIPDGYYVNEPFYETICDDSGPTLYHEGSTSPIIDGHWNDEQVYEDIEDAAHSSDPGSNPWVSKRYSRPLSSAVDSCGSEEFESYSENEDEEKHILPSNGSGNLKQRLLKKREQWREKRQSSRNLKFTLRKDSKEKENVELQTPSTPSDNKGLSRWFSIRRNNNCNIDRKAAMPDRNLYTSVNSTLPPFISGQNRMPRLLEEAATDGGIFSESFGIFEATMRRRQKPPALPPIPQGLTKEQIKRRHITGSIIHSENSYVATLQRLVQEFKKPLEESKPPILNPSKLNIIFHRVTELLHCHAFFRIELTECARHWDKEGRIGDVFVASFSKACVLEVYSDFINNFSRAIDLAKQESKKKSAFADFLKMRQITSNDRLSLFGLLVKPVQRFPQFILFLQDLLKHTPHGHHDRMSLQLALTQMESLAEMLNERKREAEQYQAFRETLKHINTKFSLRGLGEGNRYLLRQDDIVQLEFSQNGYISKRKDRRLFLTNDIVICVSVGPKGEDYSQQSERLSLKWAYPVIDVEINDTSSSPTLSRLLAAGGSKSSNSRIPEDGFVGSDGLVQQMNDLMHDYEVVSRIAALVTSLKANYEGINNSVINNVSTNIQKAIHQKDEHMSWIDACCLEFSIRTKEGKDKETFTFRTSHPSVKKDWIVELRLAQLALDKNNSPAWHYPEQEPKLSVKMPLFVKALPVFSSKHETEVNCGCCYTVMGSKLCRSSSRQVTYLWLCSSDGTSSHLTVFLIQQVGLKELVKVDLTEIRVSALTHVPALGSCHIGIEENPAKSHTIWMGTDSHRLLVYSGLDPEKQIQLSSTSTQAAITVIKYHCDQVFVGLGNGRVQIYQRGTDGAWLFQNPLSIEIENSSVLALLPISTHVYVACGIKIHVIDCFTAQIMKEFEVQHEKSLSVQLMAHSGVGLWIVQENSSTICLYHTETFRHLQDINVASNVNRMLAQSSQAYEPSDIHVTALIASKGLLWVGTNAGVALTIPLPRLEGVPIISGRANISFHSHTGPINFLLALQTQPHRVYVTQSDSTFSSEAPDSRPTTIQPGVNDRLYKQQSDGTSKRSLTRVRQQIGSPVTRRKELARRQSKTLPRDFGNFSFGGSQECDVYGVCAALLNTQNIDDETLCASDGLTSMSRYDTMRRSDPEIAVPQQSTKLDRKMRLKAARPRSLDLSTWSIESRGSSACTTISSGSEEGAHLVDQKQYMFSSRRKELDLPRTLLIVSGGRGYHICNNTDQSYSPNEKDAHIIVYEMKL